MQASPSLARRGFLKASASLLGGVGAAWAWGAVAGERRAFATPAGGIGTLTYYGQSCFLLETNRGTKVLMDPLSKGLGFELPSDLKADLVTISHEHPDHANLGLLASRPRVLRGLTVDKKGWLKIEEKFRDVSIRGIGVYHDEKRGTERGLDTIFVFEVAGMRIAHLGDLGHVLTDEQRSDIGAVDVLLVPVGGGATIDAEQANQVMQQLRPRLMVVPMHYRPPAPPPLSELVQPGTRLVTKTADQGAHGSGNKNGGPSGSANAGRRAHKGKAPPAPPVITAPPPPPGGTLATLDEFLNDKTNVRRVDGPTLTLSPVKTRPGAEVVVLGAALAR